MEEDEEAEEKVDKDVEAKEGRRGGMKRRRKDEKEENHDDEEEEEEEAEQAIFPGRLQAL